MLKRLAVVILIAFITLAALSELVLPGVLARGLERALETTFGPAGEYEVTLKSYPSARMLLGRFDEVSIMSTNVDTSTIVLESLAVTLEDASVDMKSLLGKGEFKVTRSSRSRVTIIVTQRNLEDYLAANVPEFKEPRVLVTPESVAISGYMTILSTDFVCSLVGRFVLKDEHTIGFDITGFKVDQVDVPPVFLDKWLELLNQPDLSLDLAAFPLVLRGVEVVQEDGQLVIKADTG